jgi:hypothetical protein
LSYQSAGRVRASPEQVMTWWYDPDRNPEQLERFQKAAAGELTITRSVEDGVRIRDFRWTNRKGWKYHVHRETVLTVEGMPAHEGDRFVAPLSQEVSCQSTSGSTMTMTCSGQLEYIPLPSGGTYVICTYHLAAVGRDWVRRRFHCWAESKCSDSEFHKLIARCESAIRTSAVQPT